MTPSQLLDKVRAGRAANAAANAALPAPPVATDDADLDPQVVKLKEAPAYAAEQLAATGADEDQPVTRREYDALVIALAGVYASYRDPTVAPFSLLETSAAEPVLYGFTPSAAEAMTALLERLAAVRKNVSEVDRQLQAMREHARYKAMAMRPRGT